MEGSEEMVAGGFPGTRRLVVRPPLAPLHFFLQLHSRVPLHFSLSLLGSSSSSSAATRSPLRRRSAALVVDLDEAMSLRCLRATLLPSSLPRGASHPVPSAWSWKRMRSPGKGQGNRQSFAENLLKMLVGSSDLPSGSESRDADDVSVDTGSSRLQALGANI